MKIELLAISPTNYSPTNLGPKTSSQHITAILTHQYLLQDIPQQPSYGMKLSVKKGGMDQGTVIYIHQGIFLATRKTVICRKINIHGDHQTKQIKSTSEREIYVFLHLWALDFIDTQNQM